MAEIVYLLCGATSLLCAALLLRSYLRTRTRVLMWSTVGFVGLVANNVLLFIDLVLVPTVDLSLLRSGCALIGVVILLTGLIWETR